ncbi:MAG: type II secretion system protein [Patescibacteria group bacterium]|nr:type II secretion system protein [Patescibacteria group bacterium]
MNNLRKNLHQCIARIVARARGFTLIETFVAITILITAIVAPLAIAAEGLYSALIASDQTTALFLAQDGIEYVRWVRDTNDLSGNNWLAGLANCGSTDGSKTCYFDSTISPYQSGNVTQCSGTCPYISYDTSTGFYNYNPPTSSNAPTKFIRTVSITLPVCVSGGSACNQSEASVLSTVSWQDGKLPHTFTVREDLFQWQ